MSKVTYTKKDGFHIIEIMGKSRLIPIVRDGTEFFSETVVRAQTKANLTVCINASWYKATKSAKIAIVAGKDPIPVKEITNEGFVLLGTGKVYGGRAPLMFYMAQKMDYSWQAGFGDLPTTGFYTGIGGFCPLVINGLKYGIKNIYSKTLKDPNLIGEPNPGHRPYLIQRSNATYEYLYGEDNRVGRAGLGVDKKGNLIVVAQEHGTGGNISYDGFRDIFIKFGCVNAWSVDGSDSVFLWYDGKFQFKAAANKDESQIVGIGIRVESS